MNISDLLSDNAHATLLLTSYFSKASDQNIKPLTNSEWGRFVTWLKEKSLTPADLLIANPKMLLDDWHDKKISVERIIKLLDRGHSLAFALEKWQRAGIWVITRSDQEYPRRLKQRLKLECPPVLFGCGDKSLLNNGGLAVVGSRNANDLDLVFTNLIGQKAAQEGMPIVSGGARGVDEAAMIGALQHGGETIGVIADSLIKTIASPKWRSGLMNGYATLISPFYPEAGFSAGNAMARNKYIYCLADSSLVVHSGNKGGTLSGAEENLRKGWIPLWVKMTDDLEAANEHLVKKGGHWLEKDIQNLVLSSLLKSNNSSLHDPLNDEEDLFSRLTSPSQIPEHGIPDIVVNTAPENEKSERLAMIEPQVTNNEPLLNTFDFYQVFLCKLKIIAKSPMSLDELSERMALHKSQLKVWLKQAEYEKRIKAFKRPARYQYLN